LLVLGFAVLTFLLRFNSTYSHLLWIITRDPEADLGGLSRRPHMYDMSDFAVYCILAAGILLFLLSLYGPQWAGIISPGSTRIPAPLTPSSNAVPHPGGSFSGPDWLLIWTAVGGIGSFIGGCASLVNILRTRR
jgi:hypothetical protein